MEAGCGQTSVTGEVVDHPHLYSLLNRINALGLGLLSVEPSYPEKKSEHTDSQRWW